VNGKWYPAIIIAVLLGAIVYALHADLSQPRSPRAPAQEHQKTATEQQHAPNRIALPVEIVPGPEHASDAAQQKRYADEHAAAEQDLTEATWKLASFTLALAVFAAVQVGFFFWQLRLIRDSLDDARIAAEAARDGAAAARDGADVSRLSMVENNRAYVHHAGFRWFSHFDTVAKQYFWRIRPMWVNSGNTPTRAFQVYIKYELLDREIPADYSFTPDPDPVAWAPGHIPPKGGIEHRFFDITADDMEAIRNYQKFFYVWGISKYRDVYPNTPDRVTKFFVFVVNITGEPRLAFDQNTNPVHMVFAVQRRHNCTDSECDGSEYA